MKNLSKVFVCVVLAACLPLSKSFAAISMCHFSAQGVTTSYNGVPFLQQSIPAGNCQRLDSVSQGNLADCRREAEQQGYECFEQGSRIVGVQGFTTLSYTCWGCFK